MARLVALCAAALAVVAAAAHAASPPERAEQPLLTKQPLSPALRKLVDAAHAHRAVAILEAAGCDMALVMTGAKYNQFVDLRHGAKMPRQADDSVGMVVWCQRRSPTPPSCRELAPIVVRVAHPSRPFHVFSGYNDPPFAPRCSARYDEKGSFVSGEGPEYTPG